MSKKNVIDESNGKYKVHFAFSNHGVKVRQHVILPEDKNISSVSNGFWINQDGEYTQGSDAQYWIPPSMLRLIEKISK